LELTNSDPNKVNLHSQLAFSTDEQTDKQYPVELRSSEKVLAVHSQEATLEDVFIEIAGVGPLCQGREGRHASTNDLVDRTLSCLRYMAQ
jgi:hypothetical protein